MSQTPPETDLPEPPRLRQLRWLVNTLMITLIVGFLIIVVTLVTRLNQPPAPLALPENITLPAGESARAVTLGSGWTALVTIDSGGTERIRVFDATTGQARAVTEIGSGAVAE